MKRLRCIFVGKLYFGVVFFVAFWKALSSHCRVCLMKASQFCRHQSWEETKEVICLNGHLQIEEKENISNLGEGWSLNFYEKFERLGVMFSYCSYALKIMNFPYLMNN